MGLGYSRRKTDRGLGYSRRKTNRGLGFILELVTACFYHILFWRYLNSSMTSFSSEILLSFPNSNDLNSCKYILNPPLLVFFLAFCSIVILSFKEITVSFQFRVSRSTWSTYPEIESGMRITFRFNTAVLEITLFNKKASYKIEKHS